MVVGPLSTFAVAEAEPPPKFPGRLAVRVAAPAPCPSTLKDAEVAPGGIVTELAVEATLPLDDDNEISVLLDCAMLIDTVRSAELPSTSETLAGLSEMVGRGGVVGDAVNVAVFVAVAVAVAVLVAVPVAVRVLVADRARAVWVFANALTAV